MSINEIFNNILHIFPIKKVDLSVYPVDVIMTIPF